MTCFDCHVNGHTTGQFHLNPDIRPQQRRFRLDTTSLRGVFNQQIHGSKRSLRSVEDFTEFEQRTAYFNGDPIHAMKKGFMILDRVQVSHMAQMQNMLDFPPAPKLDRRPAGSTRRRRPKRAARREAVLRQGAVRRLPPGAVLPRPPDARPARSSGSSTSRATARSRRFTLRGIKDSPPYLHDGRCLTLEDTVEFFNLVLGLKLTQQEKTDLVAFLRQL